MRVLYPLDSLALKEAGITVTRQGDGAFLELNGATIPAVIEEGQIALFPKRAAAHRKVMAALGVIIEMPK